MVACQSCFPKIDAVHFEMCRSEDTLDWCDHPHACSVFGLHLVVLAASLYLLVHEDVIAHLQAVFEAIDTDNMIYIRVAANLYQLFGAGALAHRGLPSVRGFVLDLPLAFPAPHHSAREGCPGHCDTLAPTAVLVSTPSCS